MSRLSCVLMLALVAACGDQPELAEDIDRTADMGRILLTIDELPPMPPYPRATAGRLVAVSAGDQEIQGTWDAKGGLCVDLRLLEIYAGEPGTGTAILLRLPEGDPVGLYPVIFVEQVLPEAPAARVGVQLFREPEAFGFQALEGEVELTVMGEHASGRFTSTLQEIRLNVLTRYVGVFDRVPVEPLSAGYCKAVLDSTEAAVAEDPDSLAAGTGEAR